MVSREPLVELTAVDKSFVVGRVEVPVLRGINARIDRGEYLAIRGPSGSGKTTLLEIIGAMSKPTRGTYHYAGRDVHDLDDDQLSAFRREELGFVFQSFNLIPRMTASRNVALPLLYAGLPRKECQERALELLDRVGLRHRAHHRPPELSGGECQRVAIARALANRPSLILADEPTGNLDSKAEREILGLFDEVHARGTTLVVVTHSAEVSMRAQGTIGIRDGVIASDQGP